MIRLFIASFSFIDGIIANLLLVFTIMFRIIGIKGENAN